LEACNIEPAYISEESQQEERTPGGKWAADERRVQLCSGDKPSFCCVWANEWDKYAASIYRRHYGEIYEGDIRDVSADDIPDHDLLVGGFPCQDFSIAGKRAGLDGTRGTLFYEIARICERKRPRHILLENVKGLLSAQDGKNFSTILGILSDLGYRTEWMVLNSKHFGVPQNRERVFIIGHLRGQCSGEIFPIRQQDKENVYESNGEPERRAWVSTIDSRYGERWASETYVSGDARIRRLTPVECELLQAFFPGFTEFGMLEDGTVVEISDTQRYKCLGNAVTTSVIQAIGTELMHHIKENE